MANIFKFHVRHGSEPFQRGTGKLLIEDEVIRFMLPIKSGQEIQTSPVIRNVMLCGKFKGIRRPLRQWKLPTLEINFSRLPIFLAFSLVMLMLPVPITLPLEWIFKGLAIVGGFFYILVVPLARLLVEFEDENYVCGEIAHSVLDEHYTRILG